MPIVKDVQVVDRLNKLVGTHRVEYYVTFKQNEILKVCLLKKKHHRMQINVTYIYMYIYMYVCMCTDRCSLYMYKLSLK